MSTWHFPSGGKPSPREVLYAARQALSDDYSLRGAPTERIAEQLVVGNYLRVAPSLVLVKQMLGVLEEGSHGLRSPTLQPCAFEFFWDTDAGSLMSKMNLSMSAEWIGAPAEWWDRKVPEKLTHAKTPPCTDLISEPAEVLSNRERWPIHFCGEEFTRQSTELWAEAQPFDVDSVNIHRWAAMHPLPIGRRALMTHPDVRDLSAWSEVLDILPFKEYERAVWALTVERKVGLSVNTLHLFGLADYSTESLAAYDAGPLAYSVRGKGRFLIDVLDAAEEWWVQFHGRPLRGRPKGTGRWRSREHFLTEAKAAVDEMRGDGEKITQENLAARLFTSDRHLRDVRKRFNIDWHEFRGE